jgi:hypothetical protein
MFKSTGGVRGQGFFDPGHLEWPEKGAFND